ncbi:LiaI-LiaF-like domain-containing protein [Clostridium sp. BSD9I1]|uniref:LiaF transmembrane domain-containing protein n=1 Tax=Clostridium sp. BSD9I1 TaxID=2003589 RepID=UPI001647616C|nr:DUF5668 domain-containing protein [Clostridium sp. BSD9I1]
MKQKSVLGLIFIFIGIGTLFNQLGIWDFGDIISIWWPLIIIFIGLIQITNKSISNTSGLIIIGIGAFFQLRELGIITQSLGSLLWPIVFITIGIKIIFSRSDKKFLGKGIKEVSDEYIDYFTLFSGIENKNISKNFKGGKVTAIFGGADIDLRKSELAREGAVLDLTVAFGGIDILVPEGWKVIVTGIPIFGGWSNKTKEYEENSLNDRLVLKVRCVAAFGGIDIKNYK